MESRGAGLELVKGRDIIFYRGGVNVAGYELLCEQITKSKKQDKCLLVIETPGGDPHAGFRIARALHHHYTEFAAFIPRYCKSAGTLICIGATEIYMDDRSELGPLDIQVKKDDEIIGRSSGLDIVQAMNNLQTHAISTLREVLMELTTRAALSTKVASDIACKMTTGIYEPIYAQIDPIKIAEMHRATSIAFDYGNRLNEKSGNLLHDGLRNLVLAYPSHGFVIDRKEARTSFNKVHDAKEFVFSIVSNYFKVIIAANESSMPTVFLTDFTSLIPKDTSNEDFSAAAAAQGGDDRHESKIKPVSKNNSRSVKKAKPRKPNGAAMQS